MLTPCSSPGLLPVKPRLLALPKMIHFFTFWMHFLTIRKDARWPELQGFRYTLNSLGLIHDMLVHLRVDLHIKHLLTENLLWIHERFGRRRVCMFMNANQS